MTRREYTWWLTGDSFGGAEMVLASSALEARQYRRGTFRCVYELGGLSQSAALRKASQARIHIIAGGLTEQQAGEILRAWQAGNVIRARNAGRVYHNDPGWNPPYPPQASGQ